MMKSNRHRKLASWKVILFIIFLLFTPVNAMAKNIAHQDWDEGEKQETVNTQVTVSASTGNTPYRHVTPADVGVKIGVGVTGPVPTEEYTGPATISTPTIIENKVVNGCLRIDSDDVTIRNTIINCGGNYPLHVVNTRRNFTLEYSRVTCLSSGKIFYFQNGAPDATIANNEAMGCEDFFFIQGDLDGVVVQNNYMHTLVGTPQAHADGFQIGEFLSSSGTIRIQGNYFDPDNESIGKTGLIFGSNTPGAVHLLIEDNFIEPWGHYTIRCNSETSCDIRNNVFSLSFAASVEYILLVQSTGPATFKCNRYADGNFVEEYNDGKDVILGTTHDTENCPRFKDSLNPPVVSPWLMFMLAPLNNGNR